MEYLTGIFIYLFILKKYSPHEKNLPQKRKPRLRLRLTPLGEWPATTSPKAETNYSNIVT
jgi:hypothetical protein